MVYIRFCTIRRSESATSNMHFQKTIIGEKELASIPPPNSFTNSPFGQHYAPMSADHRTGCLDQRIQHRYYTTRLDQRQYSHLLSVLKYCIFVMVKHYIFNILKYYLLVKLLLIILSKKLPFIYNPLLSIGRNYDELVI